MVSEVLGMKNGKGFENKIGVHVPSLLLPNKDIDLTKWAVIACDQYTSQPDYWKEVENIVGDSPSTYHLIFPEAFLGYNNGERIGKINHNMLEYMDKKILVEHGPAFIYTDRRTSRSKSRKGLIIAVDLEFYDYGKNSHTLIRATEGTVVDRLPPRIKIRQNAPIELPHIMLLIDDPDKTVIEPLSEKAESFEKLYDFDLMMNGGHIKGYKIDDENTISGIISSLEKLIEPEVYKSRYELDSCGEPLLFAVGDGNHSLATAKACWESLKSGLSPEERENHPARFALVEMVNVHDSGITFEPIHRVVFNADVKDLLDKMAAYYEKTSKVVWTVLDTKERILEEAAKYRGQPGIHAVPFVSKDLKGLITVENPAHNIEVGTLQGFLDEYLKSNPSARVDYIHGDEVVDRFAVMENNIGFYLPSMDKKDLFKTVILDGVLPRKTFSMGEAEEKRFYIECRKIR